MLYTDIHILEYYSAIEKEQNLAICNNADGSVKYYAQRNKSDKER